MSTSSYTVTIVCILKNTTNKKHLLNDNMLLTLSLKIDINKMGGGGGINHLMDATYELWG